MTDRQALIEAIRSNPAEDTPRLALADWYDENGDPARGEFIRVQCELARIDPISDDYAEVHVRQLQIQAEYEREWLGGWADQLVRWEFNRGMLEEITIQPYPYCRFGADLFRDHPIGRVSFVDDQGESLEPKSIRDVLSQPHSRHLRSIDAAACREGEQAAAMFGGRIHTNDWLRELADATALTGLRELSLYGGTRSGRDELDLKAWEGFCRAPHLAGVAALDLSNHYADTPSTGMLESAIRELVAARFAGNLQSVRISGYAISHDALLWMIRSGRLAQLRSFDLGMPSDSTTLASVLREVLDLSNLPAVDELSLPFGGYTTELAEHPGWNRIRRLDFTYAAEPRGPVEEHDASAWRAICRSTQLQPRAFRLSQYSFHPERINLWEELAGAPWFGNLSELTIDLNDHDCSGLVVHHLDDFPRLSRLNLTPNTEVVEHLAAWPGLAGLVELGLNDSYAVTDAAAAAKLFRSPYLTTRLRKLRASGICRSEEAVRAMADCEALVGLEHLDFAFNGLSKQSAQSLADCPHLRHLKSLHTWSEWEETEQSEAAAWLTFADSKTFPQLRDLVVGSETLAEVQSACRRRFGPRLRVFADY